jgi:protein-S-isoprenylcysteine O-methyltransferase Ste14
MTPPQAPLEPRYQQRLGTVLVGLQFGLIAGVGVLAAPAFTAGSAPAGAWVSALSGGLLGAWALLSHPRGNFNIRPTPRAGGRLVSQGPYRWIRHPMYSAVALCAAAGAWAASAAWGSWGWLLTAALMAVLFGKALLEERWMTLQHPDYKAYQAVTKRFIPTLF